jgi:3-hydroxyisobutyrate dehydrogenase-like beta-hydroxyacid dehydrogenase
VQPAGKPSWRLASKTNWRARANLGTCTCRNVGAVDGVDIALTMLANDDAVRAAAFGELRCCGTSSASCPMVAPGLKNVFESVLTGSQEGWWNTVLGTKDAGLALDIAQEANVELPIAWVVPRRDETAAASGLDNADIAAVTKLYRARRRLS